MGISLNMLWLIRLAVRLGVIIDAHSMWMGLYSCKRNIGSYLLIAESEQKINEKRVQNGFSMRRVSGNLLSRQNVTRKTKVS